VWGAFSVYAVGEAYTPPPFSHYQPILDRMPFGTLPPNFNAAVVDPATVKSEAQEKAEQQALAKKINMSAVNVTPDGQTALGFTDLSVTPPVNYYLLVGASAGGWTVVNADYDEETATIEKEGVTITLKLGKGLVDPATLPAKAAAARTATTATSGPSGRPSALSRLHIPPPGLQRSGQAPSGPNIVVPEPPGESRSYAERQLERATQQTAAQIAAEAKQREQFIKLASEAAANAIKRREEEAAQAAAIAEEQQAAQQAQ
jgi:hypothetical protein